MARAVVVKVLQARFPQTPVPEGVHAALAQNTDLQKLTAWLQNAALTGSPADFERFLASRATCSAPAASSRCIGSAIVPP